MYIEDDNNSPDRDNLDYGPEPTGVDVDDLDPVTPEDDGEPELDEDGNPVAPDDEGEDAEFSIQIEGDEPVKENSVVRELRETARRQARELAALRAGQAPQKVELGKKPDLWEDCDGDAEVFERELTGWHQRKAAAEAEAKAVEQAAAKHAEEWGRVESSYTAKAQALGAPNYRMYEERVQDTLSPDLVKAIKFYMNDPAKVIAALGSNSRLLEKVTAEQDPIRALFHLRDVEGKINVMRKPPKPESGTIPRGNAPVASGSADKQLAKLEAQADKSGDRTALIRYKQQLKAKG